MPKDKMRVNFCCRICQQPSFSTYQRKNRHDCANINQQKNFCVYNTININGHPLHMLEAYTSTSDVIREFYNNIKKCIDSDTGIQTTQPIQEILELKLITSEIFDIFQQHIIKLNLNGQRIDQTTGLELLIGEYFYLNGQRNDSNIPHNFLLLPEKQALNTLNHLDICQFSEIETLDSQICIKLRNIRKRINQIPNHILKWCLVIYIITKYSQYETQVFHTTEKTYTGKDLLIAIIENNLALFDYKFCSETKFNIGDLELDITLPTDLGDIQIQNTENVVYDRITSKKSEELFLHILDRSMWIYSAIHYKDTLDTANFCSYIYRK